MIWYDFILVVITLYTYSLSYQWKRHITILHFLKPLLISYHTPNLSLSSPHPSNSVTAMVDWFGLICVLMFYTSIREAHRWTRLLQCFRQGSSLTLIWLYQMISANYFFLLCFRYTTPQHNLSFCKNDILYC